MKKCVVSILFVMCFVPFLAADGNIRPVSTYSIVAYDKETGQLGVAVQSHWFSVGSVAVSTF